MSEQIEIEVGVNAKNFQQAITNIQRSLKGLANVTTNVRVDGLQKGLDQVQKSLVLAPYHKSDSLVKIAEQKGVTVNSLYKKVGRLRDKLGKCVQSSIQSDLKAQPST